MAGVPGGRSGLLCREFKRKDGEKEAYRRHATLQEAGHHEKVTETFIGNVPRNDPGTLTPTGPTSNLIVPTKGRYYITRWDIKIDHQFSSSNKVFGRYSQNRVRAPGRYSNELLWALPDPVYVSPVGCRRNVDARRLGRAILNVG
jgi:hypothetical protein